MADGTMIRGQMMDDLGQRPGVASPRIVQTTVFLLLSSVLGPLCAEDLPDPTRRPSSFAVPGAGAVSGQLRRSSGLHTTIISKSRRAAIIDGKTVELGEMHGNSRLVEVNEGSVVLQGEKTRRVLTLFPDVRMKRSAK